MTSAGLVPDPAAHAIAVVGVCASFAGAGYLMWRRSMRSDQLASKRAQQRALAMAGFGCASTGLAAAIGVADLLLAVLIAGWILAVIGVSATQVFAEVRERHEAHRRNAALGWPLGKPPPHPDWAVAATFAWTVIIGVIEWTVARRDSWLAALATGVGAAQEAAMDTLLAVWVVGVAIGISTAVVLASRRRRWRRHSSDDSSEPRNSA